MSVVEIKKNACGAVVEAFKNALLENKSSFVAYLVQGDYIKLLEGNNCPNIVPKPSPYCTDYMMDIYGDESREKFYVRYLNRRYKNDGFAYQGDEGIDDLNVEMMIYAHVWESEWFLKNLYRLGRIVSGNKYYDWDVSSIKFHGYNMLDDIKQMFKSKCPKLYTIIDESYRGYIRDSFAHMLFNIDENSRIINLNSNHVKGDVHKSRISFGDFQSMFLNSVELNYEFRHLVHDARINLAKSDELSSILIELPNGKKMVIQNSDFYHGEPRFRGTIII